MNKQEIIAEFAKSRKLERYVFRLGDNRELMKELVQEVYLALLTCPEEKIRKLYKEGKLQVFAFGIARTLLFSVTSPFYYKYVRYETNKQSLDFFDPEQDV